MRSMRVWGYVLALVGYLAVPSAWAGPFDSLYKKNEARTKRVSSSDSAWRDGNNDRIAIDPGQTATLAEIKGPGIIRHIWFTVWAEDPKYGRSVVLRIYWDGSDEPAVESPLGDFFAVGHGMLADVDSLMVAVSGEGRAYNCYWPMPFRKGARITLSNDSDRHKVRLFYYYIDYEAVDELPEGTAYFHAQYRQEYPAKPGDYLVLDAQGSGRYVGTVLSVRFRTRSWFGEGDDRFYIDGEEVPSLQGTGTEDYFCDAWGFREVHRPFYGVPVWEGAEVGDRVTAYRWHLTDPVHFKESLRFCLEHKGMMFNEQGERISGHYERPDLFSSVAYWYQTGQARRYADIPPAEERLVPEKLIQLDERQSAYEMKGGTPRMNEQTLSFTSGEQVLLTNDKVGFEVTVPFRLDEAITGLVMLKQLKSHDFGIYRIKLNGRVPEGMDQVDLYAPRVTGSEIHFGFQKLPAGENTITFECVGRNANSTNYYLGIDALRVEVIEPYIHKTEDSGSSP